MNTKLIKIIEKPVLTKEETTEELEVQDFLDDTTNTQHLELDTKQVLNVKHSEYYYHPASDYPLVQSVANSGWQVSDIWRDLRVDNFCS
ncbi:MAG: hypothetical protein NHB32_18860 [Fischerella sp. CENA71]|nr:hypothetical protein [Fischerella sp. CENA71]